MASRSARWLRLAVRARAVIGGERGTFERIRRQFYAELWQRTAEALGAEIKPIGGELIRIRKGAASTLVRRSSLMLDSRVVLELAGNKPACNRLFADAGLPIVRHVEFDLDSFEKAWEFAQECANPVVVKPARAGSAGRGVTTGVTTRGALKRAAWSALAHGDGILCEEQVAGASLRLLYLDGRCIDAIRRDPPSVVGDGHSNLRTLLRAENEARRQAPWTAMHPLRSDREMRQCLAVAGRSLASVPGGDEIVRVKRVVNENSARDNVRILGDIHPSIVAAGRSAAAALPVRLAGVDFLTTDATAPLAQTGGIVHEVNTEPALHHHVLCHGEPETDVAAIVLAHLLSGESR